MEKRTYGYSEEVPAAARKGPSGAGHNRAPKPSDSLRLEDLDVRARMALASAARAKRGELEAAVAPSAETPEGEGDDDIPGHLRELQKNIIDAEAVARRDRRAA